MSVWMFAFVLLGCDGPTGDTAVACEDPAWDSWTHGFFVSYCDSCHAASAPDRHGAPAAVTFDTEAEARAQADAVRRRVIDLGTMPAAGGVFPEDLTRLETWLDCE